ncbi:YceI family protein [Macrococcus bovicus]|uniref:YceI family protein n=1 Tax=Macrococcus bovicus TaxID=69968 RepID=UPI0025A64C1D|nr:YceI family protein [Macrococcus bovicus]WJP97820.1 YceI family protein [Macrococcus bovicus]
MTNFKLDPVHSSVAFSVKHLMVSKITGEFKDFDGELTGDVNDVSSLRFKGSVKVDSIDTRNADRDGHLKSADFFDAEQYPDITFVSESITDSKVTGNLTIKGETHQETFDIEYNGASKNPMSGGQVTGIVVTGKINREDYGISWNQALETGGVMVSKDVAFTVGLEFAIEE